LREQWAGLFQELLKRMQGQEQIATLQAQVAQLAEINTTLKRYLETVVESVAPKESKALIENEERRLDDARMDRLLSENSLAKHLLTYDNFDIKRLRICVSEAKSVSGFLECIGATPDVEPSILAFSEGEPTQKALLGDINRMRRVLGLPLLISERDRRSSTEEKTVIRRRTSKTPAGS
jgi:hypothetical protein